MPSRKRQVLDCLDKRTLLDISFKFGLKGIEAQKKENIAATHGDVSIPNNRILYWIWLSRASNRVTSLTTFPMITLLAWERGRFSCEPWS